MKELYLKQNEEFSSLSHELHIGKLLRHLQTKHYSSSTNGFPNHFLNPDTTSENNPHAVQN